MHHAWQEIYIVLGCAGVAGLFYFTDPFGWWDKGSGNSSRPGNTSKPAGGWFSVAPAPSRGLLF
jgi:hypothetical protein